MIFTGQFSMARHGIVIWSLHVCHNRLLNLQTSVTHEALRASFKV